MTKDDDMADMWDPHKLVLKFFSEVDTSSLDPDDNKTIFAKAKLLSTLAINREAFKGIKVNLNKKHIESVCSRP